MVTKPSNSPDRTQRQRARANWLAAMTLLWLAVAAVAWSIHRAGAGSVFPHGWWRPR